METLEAGQWQKYLEIVINWKFKIILWFFVTANVWCKFHGLVLVFNEDCEVFFSFFKMMEYRNTVKSSSQVN